MGIFDRLFGKKAQSTGVQAPGESPTVVKASFSNRFLRIMKINFYGPFSKSTSGEWVVAWRDLDPEQHRGGYRESGLGDYLLFNTRTNSIVLQGKMERPNHGHIANDGHFSLEDWHFGSELSGTFYVFSPTGEPKIKRAVNANIFNSALSDDGRFATLQTANNPNSDDGNLLVALDVEHNKELFAIHPQTGWADKYEFEENPLSIVVSLNGIGKFRYDMQGNFIDAKKYQTACLNSKRYEVVLPTVAELLKTDVVSKEDAQKALEATISARSLGADNDKGWKATALKLQGQANEALGNIEDAIAAYEEALSINPKIGVKQRMGTLKKKRPSSTK